MYTVWLLFTTCVFILKFALRVASAVVADAVQFELCHDLIVTTPRVMSVEENIPPVPFIVHLRRRVAALSTVFRASALEIVPILSSPVTSETEPRERVLAAVHIVSVQKDGCSTAFGVPPSGLVKAGIVILVFGALIVVRDLVPTRSIQFETL